MNEERAKRKLSGILSADAVGYSRLMRQDESATVTMLKECREIMASLIQKYNGRVVDSPGDNILAEFFEKYLQQTIQNYLSHKAAVDDQFKQWLEMGLNFTQKAQKTMVDLSPFKSFLDPFNSSSNDSEEK